MTSKFIITIIIIATSLQCGRIMIVFVLIKYNVTIPAAGVFYGKKFERQTKNNIFIELCTV